MEAGRIGTWPEVVTHLRQQWGAHAEPEPGERVEVTAEGFSVEVRVAQAFGTSWIDVVGVLGSPKDASTQHILERNFKPRIGAIGLRDGALVIRQRLPLDGLRSLDLDTTVSSIAGQCAQGVIQLRIGLRKNVRP